MSARPEEVALHGGLTNAGRVVRVGDTVRRPQRPTSAATHALLRHLEAVGFDGAPRLLGTDDRGREVLTFVTGDAAVAPPAAWALTDEALVSVAQLLRRFHDAVAGFDPAPYAWSPAVPSAYQAGLVSHNDPNLDNVVFVDGRAVALIDFDLAGPGSAIWDVACAARLWAPLRDAVDVTDARLGRELARLRLFVDAYGLTAGERQRVVDAVADAHEWCYDVVGTAAGTGHEAFREYWQAGGSHRAARTRAWLLAHEREMRAALDRG